MRNILTGYLFVFAMIGAIQVLRKADGGGGQSWWGCQIFQKKALQRCKVQCYLRYEGVGGGPISRKKRYVTLEWPHTIFL